MPPQFIFEMRNVSKAFGEKVVLRNINLSFYYGAKIGVVGENGAGKSTLLRIMAGLDRDIDGTATLAKGMRVRYVAQEPHLDLEKTVRDNLRTAMKPVQDLIDRFNAVSARMAEPGEGDDMDKLIDEMGQLQEKIEACDGWELDRMLDIASDALVLPPDDAPVGQLSGGERRRVALCMALLERPDLLLLDEPTNHLDAETAQWLEQTLREYPGTVIIVTHDRYFLDNITKWILELDGGRGMPFEGNYSSWVAQRIELLRIAEKKESQRQKTLQRELDWIRNSHQGRLQKNQARVSAYEELASHREMDSKSETIIQIAPGPRLGDKVLSFRRVSKAYASNGDSLKLLEDCTFDLPPGGIVGVIGPNGAGKTTLLRMIVGQEQPDSGEIALGQSVELSYVDQHRDALNDENSIFEEITGGKDKIELGERLDELPRLRRPLQLPRPAAAEKGRPMLRRRAEPHPPGEDAAAGRKPRPAGRTDQRPRRQHDARARTGPDRLSRLRHGDQPRPLLPRPRLHPPVGARRRRQDAMVRGQLRRLRKGRRRGEPRPRRPSAKQVPPAGAETMNPVPSPSGRGLG